MNDEKKDSNDIPQEALALVQALENGERKALDKCEQASYYSKKVGNDFLAYFFNIPIKNRLIWRRLRERHGVECVYDLDEFDRVNKKLRAKVRRALAQFIKRLGVKSLTFFVNGDFDGQREFVQKFGLDDYQALVCYDALRAWKWLSRGCFED